MQKPLPFPELEEERDRAGRVKQETPVLVILGNPPYNGFAGMAPVDEEERALTTAYRTTKRVRRPEGQGLNDLYVRFFRMAERRIAEKTGRGVVCFISNYSWLDGLSFTGMRERYLEGFDAIRIDCLNGDKYKTGKTTPNGAPDPSIFSTPGDPVGIQVGTAITTLVRKTDHKSTGKISFRNLWGQAKLADLTATAEAEPSELYDSVEPSLPLGLPFAQMVVNAEWTDWPALPDLFLISFPGVQSKRDAFLIDGSGAQRRPNLSEAAQCYLDRLGASVEDLFHHVLAVLHDPAYREVNAGALRMEWPRIPLPGWSDGDCSRAAEELAASAARGRELAALLDSETPVPGVTTGALRTEAAAVAVPATPDGGNMTGKDFDLTASWGHFGQGRAVMPGQGRVVERAYTAEERAALSRVAPLGETTFDIYLNDRAYWRNVPAAVWTYKLGGYQVLKKWLPYRESAVLDRPLKPEEVQHFTNTARRIAAILLATNR